VTTFNGGSNRNTDDSAGSIPALTLAVQYRVRTKPTTQKGNTMSRTKKPVTARVYGVGSLMSMTGDPQTLFIDAVTEDDRRVFVGFKASDWSVEKFGKNVSEARRMRELAKTLMKAADKLEAIPDTTYCANPECHAKITYSQYTDHWHEVGTGARSCPDGLSFHKPINRG
jgi:hypothetical protein